MQAPQQHKAAKDELKDDTAALVSSTDMAQEAAAGAVKRPATPPGVTILDQDVTDVAGIKLEEKKPSEHSGTSPQILDTYGSENSTPASESRKPTQILPPTVPEEEKHHLLSEWTFWYVYSMSHRDKKKNKQVRRNEYELREVYSFESVSAQSNQFKRQPVNQSNRRTG